MKRNITRRSFVKGMTVSAIGAAGISFLPLKGLSAAEEKKVNFYNWDTYIGENTLADFGKATGIDAKMDLFADNSELFAKLRGGNPGYDVIVPTNDFVPRMAEAGLLEKLNHAMIPNMKNLDKAWTNLPFDSKNVYSVPYMWGTMGMGYRKSKTKGVRLNTMKYVLDSDKFAGKLAWISEAGTMFDLAMKYLGYDPVNPTLESIEAAEELLTKQKKYVKVIAEDNGQDLLLSGEVDVCIEWSGDISQVSMEDPDIAYAIAPNGSYRWCDNLSIPKGAPHPQNAHAFINYLLDADVGKEIAEYIGYGTPNIAAFRKTSREYKSDKSRFPAKSVLNKLYFPEYNGEEISRKVEQAWTRVLAS